MLFIYFDDTKLHCALSAFSGKAVSGKASLTMGTYTPSVIEAGC